ncbi:hypothetical protein TRFO_14619 [Tritrichomonas foetus]|uniref:Uncharacterized protein n=1 Tax=Tritrichomonas foetus TaxID=1144522 RepID=A0A1J4KUL3_9EUKA|nr:hypothetical protein TRFO_14619 [Tritrichomonas foetus]|eukprot:OHT14959.1 hypothetical protein TRFO_14619 [Tritrichomonas foetus]
MNFFLSLMENFQDAIQQIKSPTPFDPETLKVEDVVALPALRDECWKIFEQSNFKYNQLLRNKKFLHYIQEYPPSNLQVPINKLNQQVTNFSQEISSLEKKVCTPIKSINKLQKNMKMLHLCKQLQNFQAYFSQFNEQYFLVISDSNNSNCISNICKCIKIYDTITKKFPYESYHQFNIYDSAIQSMKRHINSVFLSLDELLKDYQVSPLEIYQLMLLSKDPRHFFDITKINNMIAYQPDLDFSKNYKNLSNCLLFLKKFKTIEKVIPKDYIDALNDELIIAFNGLIFLFKSQLESYIIRSQKVCIDNYFQELRDTMHDFMNIQKKYDNLFSNEFASFKDKFLRKIELNILALLNNLTPHWFSDFNSFVKSLFPNLFNDFISRNKHFFDQLGTNFVNVIVNETTKHCEVIEMFEIAHQYYILANEANNTALRNISIQILKMGCVSLFQYCQSDLLVKNEKELIDYFNKEKIPNLQIKCKNADLYLIYEIGMVLKDLYLKDNDQLKFVSKNYKDFILKGFIPKMPLHCIMMLTSDKKPIKKKFDRFVSKGFSGLKLWNFAKQTLQSRQSYFSFNNEIEANFANCPYKQ